jgi:acyl-CoA thioesterase FadM
MTNNRTELRFAVRGIELGADGAVPPSFIPRYMEHSRWECFKVPGFVLQGKLSNGVVRAQTVQIEDRLRYGDEVVIETWLARLGRTSFDFGNTLCRAGGGVVARSRTTIVQIGPGGPIPMDPSLAEHVSHDPAPEHRRDSTPLADAFEHRVVVRPSDTDAWGHVNQARYVDYVDDARKILARAGHPLGADGAILAIGIEYVREALSENDLSMRIAHGERDDERRVELRRGDEVITRMWARFGTP